MGVGVHCNQAYIIDFGLAKEFRDARTHVHIPFRQDYDFLTGTTPYASLNNHQGIEQSRRDDLESLAYIFIYFFCGSLPWQNAKASTDKQRDMILRKKLDSLPKLLRALPDEFSTFLNYTRALRFEDKPDYAYLRKLFHDLHVREGYQDDNAFDWHLPRTSLYDETRASNGAGATRKSINGKVASSRVYVLFHFAVRCSNHGFTDYVLTLAVNNSEKPSHVDSHHHHDLNCFHS